MTLSNCVYITYTLYRKYRHHISSLFPPSLSLSLSFWLIIDLSPIQRTRRSVLSSSESSSVPERPGAVLRVERASDEMRASTEAELPGESLAPRGHQMSGAYRSRGRRLERMERLVTLSTRHGGTIVRARSRPFASTQ